ncbi:MAG: helix-turn-helix domain-containing protein, partial [Candidatus Bipolaricaulaceae bacterium]
ERRVEGKEWFTVAEAARILGVGWQAIHDAVRKGRLRAQGQARRIHGVDLLGYALRTGKDPRAVIQRLQEEREVSLGDAFLWILVGLGLAWLLGELARSRKG